MTEQELKVYIDQRWRKLNTLGSYTWNIKDCYEINLFTKEVRNIESGRISNWNETQGSFNKRLTVFTKSGKATDLQRTKIDKLLRYAQ